MPHSSAVASFLIAVVLSAAGCAGSAPDPADGNESPATTQAAAHLDGKKWVLASLGGDPALPADKLEARPNLQFDGKEHRVTGSTGVNLLSGAYEQAGETLKFGELITTRRAGPPELMKQESTLLKALEATATAQTRDGSLTLHDASGAELARFEGEPK